jgi:hypothetical protein
MDNVQNCDILIYHRHKPIDLKCVSLKKTIILCSIKQNCQMNSHQPYLVAICAQAELIL